jgi:hypothetical protein
MRKPGTQPSNKRGHGKNTKKVTHEPDQREDGRQRKDGAPAGESVEEAEKQQRAVHP